MLWVSVENAFLLTFGQSWKGFEVLRGNQCTVDSFPGCWIELFKVFESLSLLNWPVRQENGILTIIRIGIVWFPSYKLRRAIAIGRRIGLGQCTSTQLPFFQVLHTYGAFIDFIRHLRVFSGHFLLRFKTLYFMSTLGSNPDLRGFLAWALQCFPWSGSRTTYGPALFDLGMNSGHHLAHLPTPLAYSFLLNRLQLNIINLKEPLLYKVPNLLSLFLLTQPNLIRFSRNQDRLQFNLIQRLERVRLDPDRNNRLLAMQVVRLSCFAIQNWAFDFTLRWLLTGMQEVLVIVFERTVIMVLDCFHWDCVGQWVLGFGWASQ